ncbi:hypothetical protein HD806DRAFT_500352 [Xylariaceae sp. AK1471]|nr:hypothetical protein HD806DRAFT_500352 [Xylariaceae sp. AK1471]
MPPSIVDSSGGDPPDISIISDSHTGLDELQPENSPNPLLLPKSLSNSNMSSSSRPSPDADSSPSTSKAPASEAMADRYICKPCAEWIRKHVTNFDNKIKSTPPDISSADQSVLTGYEWSTRSDECCYICTQLSGALNISNVPAQHYHTTATSYDINYLSTIHPMEAIEQPTTIPEDLWTPETALLARSWLHECLTNGGCPKVSMGRGGFHEACQWSRQSRQLRYLPRRLVYIVHDGNTLQAALRETEQFPIDVHYVTVSHRWGSDSFLTLTSDNYEDFKTAIPLCDPQFSKTFLDILRVAIDLNYHYVWIDSLCIQQGESGASDWAEECPRMACIYKYAELNITVAGTIGSGGILAKRQGLHEISPPQIYLPTRGFHYLVDDKFIRNQIQSFPLWERGWIIQEQLLSTRILYFTSQGVIWKCLEGEASDTFDTIIRKPTWMQYHKEGARIFTAHGEEVKDTVSALASWYYEIVTRYSRTQVTKKQDKLPALSGLAAMLQQRIGSRYLAGHWEVSLLNSLCWRLASPAGKTLEQEGYIAPSWSWASTSSAIIPNYFKGDSPISRIIRAEVECSTLDPYGAVQAGFITIKGPLLELNSVYLVQQPQDELHIWLQISEHLCACFWPSLDNSSDYQTASHEWRHPSNDKSDDTDYDSEAFFVLPISINAWYGLRIRGLILRPGVCRQPSYSRVGYFELSEFSRTLGHPKFGDEITQHDVQQEFERKSRTVTII